MVRDREYYLTLDVEKLADEMAASPVWRGQHENFGDLVWALWYRSQVREVPITEIVRVLGEPDRKEFCSDGVVWVYKSIFQYGPCTVTSEIPFLIRENRLIDIIPSSDWNSDEAKDSDSGDGSA